MVYNPSLLRGYYTYKTGIYCNCKKAIRHIDWCIYLRLGRAHAGVGSLRRVEVNQLVAGWRSCTTARRRVTVGVESGVHHRFRRSRRNSIKFQIKWNESKPRLKLSKSSDPFGRLADVSFVCYSISLLLRKVWLPTLTVRMGFIGLQTVWRGNNRDVELVRTFLEWVRSTT